jgi:hypothetical protein
MRIIYVGKHNSGLNDDEGAVVHGFESLGHKVIRLAVNEGMMADKTPGDLLIFNKWDDPHTLFHLDGRIPRVFWYWDMVMQNGDPSVERRCLVREQWMARIIPHIDLGFCTDGDWVARDKSGKLLWLPQGADQRYVGQGGNSLSTVPILFTGIGKGGGNGRISFVEEMQSNWGSQFTHIVGGVYGKNLRDLIARTKIVVAPDSPATDRYWSIRVYTICGYGGFLLHPYCAGLSSHYQGGRDIIYYHNREELHDLVRAFLQDSTNRSRIAAAALKRTTGEHTYQHRCKELLKVVEQRLGVK